MGIIISLKKSFYIILNISMLVSIVFTLMIYTSLNPNLPWHESCGTQFLAIFFIFDPVLIVIFWGFSLLKSSGYEINKNNIKLPIYILIGISIPLIIDGSLGVIAIYSGITVCIISIVKIIIYIVNNFRLCNKSKLN